MNYGEDMSILKKYTFKSEQKGYNILFLGAVHGNEQAGTKAIFKVITKFASKAISPLKGSVSFIPVCNPKAFDANVRQIDENLNRIVKKYDNPVSYEQMIANELVEHIQSADIIIDLHSTQALDTKPFIFNDYPDNFVNEMIAAQTVEYVVEGWPEIYESCENIQDFSTGFCAHEAGKCCVTVECGSHFSEDTIHNAYNIIMNTLLYFGMVEGFATKKIKQKVIVMDEIFIKTKEGRLSREFKHLDEIKQGEVVAFYDDGTQLISSRDCFILLPKSNALVKSEWFYFGHIK